MKLKYQLRNYNLEHELKKYCKQKKIFPERRLIRIIREVADCLQYLKLNETCHGDVKLSSIFLRDERPAQILDSYFIHKGRTAFEIVLDNAQSQSFLSPEQLGLMRDRMFPKLECIHASEVYSLGLTMVEVTTVQAALECYNL